MLHGSSEFMLVLYPKEEDSRQHELQKEVESLRRDSHANKIVLSEFLAVGLVFTLMFALLFLVIFRLVRVSQYIISFTWIFLWFSLITNFRHIHVYPRVNNSELFDKNLADSLKYDQSP